MKVRVKCKQCGKTVWGRRDKLTCSMSWASGRLCANLVGAIAEWEGDIISERTKAALAQLKDRGVRLGNAPTIPPATERKVLKAYESEGSYLGAARRLNEAGVPTVNAGARWHPTTVATVVKRKART